MVNLKHTFKRLFIWLLLINGLTACSRMNYIEGCIPQATYRFEKEIQFAVSGGINKKYVEYLKKKRAVWPFAAYHEYNPFTKQYISDRQIIFKRVMSLKILGPVFQYKKSELEIDANDITLVLARIDSSTVWLSASGVDSLLTTNMQRANSANKLSIKASGCR